MFSGWHFYIFALIKQIIKIMIITKNQAKQIIEKFKQIDGVVDIFDICITEYDEYVSAIELLYCGGNMNDDDIISDYMVNSLCIDKNSFEIEYNPLVGGISWHYISIHDNIFNL